MNVMEKQYPQVIEMEKEVLGMMLLGEGKAIPKISSVLREEDFYASEHQIIYREIMKLYNKGITPDLLTLSEEMRQSGELNKVGGVTYLMVLAEASFTTAFAERYAQKIKEKSLMRRLILIGEILTEDATADLKPLKEILSETEEMLNEIRNKTETAHISRFSKYFARNFRRNVKEMKEYGRRETGYENIDKEQIFTPGLYVLGGLPALGKTTFAWQLLEQLARRGEKCIYCSYEMSEFELFSKSLTRELFKRDRKTGLTSAGIRRGDETRILNEILEEFEKDEIDMNVMEMQEQDIDELLFELRKYCIEKAPVIVLDYLQIVPIKGKDTTAKQAIDEIVRKLKNFQRETGTTFIVISSFNRANYTQQVAFESFKESGNIEYSADVVWGLQFYATRELKEGVLSIGREIISKAKEANPRQVELKCLKNRQGRNYSCFFEYYPAVDTFEACEEEKFKEIRGKKVRN